MWSKCHHTDVDATSLYQSDAIPTSVRRHVPAGLHGGCVDNPFTAYESLSLNVLARLELCETLVLYFLFKSETVVLIAFETQLWK